MICRLSLCGFWLVLSLSAQSISSVNGIVRDAQGGVIAGARVDLENVLTGYAANALTGMDGGYRFTNVPTQPYQIRVSKPGFANFAQRVTLRTNVPQTVDIALQLADQATTVQVIASETQELVNSESTGTRTELNAAAISRMPVPPTSRGLESVLLSFPGFAANANGAIHPRGAHNQMTYVIDGMPVSDQLTGAFANAVDPTIVQSIELFTGNIPAEFGSKVSGVAVIATRTGLGLGRAFSGSTQVSAAGFNTYSQATDIAGGTERFGYFASVNTLKSQRYLDQVSLDNLHNGGNSERVFTRLDYLVTPTDQLRLNLLAGRSGFQLANLRSQHAAGQDQRQLLRDFSVTGGWLRTLSANTTLDHAISYRTSIAQLLPSAGDTPVTASQARHLSTLMGASRLSHERGRHSIRAGADVQHFPVSEHFTFGITSPSFNDPASDGFIPTLLAHDLSRGGALFQFVKKKSGNLYSGFVQDTIRLGRLTLSLGSRYDNYRFLTKGSQWQPRVGLAFHLRETHTVLRASYNRTYQTPPNENLLLSGSDESSALVPPGVKEQLGGALLLIRPERQNVFEAGFQQALGRRLSLDGAVYHKNSLDLQDNDNFFNTGIIFPTSLKASRTNGAEMRATILPMGGFSGSVSLTHYHTVVTPPFTGGLFLGSAAVDLLNAGPFVIDHDQRLGVQVNTQYNITRSLWMSGTVRHDSGLVSNPSDPGTVAADPDYADLLPYVNLESDPPRVRPRTIADLAVGYDRTRNDRKQWSLVAQVSNLTDRTALYNFQSIFVGTRLVQPRTMSVKLRWYF